MINIDQYAYTSKLKQTDPLLKLFFGGLTLGVCLWADSLPIALLILALMSRETVYNGGIPLTVLLKLLLVPMSFLIIGVLTIAINVSTQQRDFWCALPIWDVHLGISATGGQQALRLFWKALGAASCLYYISLSTPLVDLLIALRRLHVPALLVELMGLIYRFIFVLFETAETMLTAQKSRLGYASLTCGYRSFGALLATLFIRAYKQSNELYTALEARGYTGELHVLEDAFETRWTAYLKPLGLNGVLMLATLALRRLSGRWL